MKRIRSMAWSMAAAMVMSIMFAVTALAASSERYYFAATESAYWDSSDNGVARWEKVEKAKKYEVVLYEGDQKVKRVYSSGTRVDLSEYMSNNSTYSFAVRAVPTDSQTRFRAGDWVASDELDVDWLGETDGRWRTYSTGKKYQKSDRSYCTEGWELIQGDWYHFNAEGYVETGWITVGQTWYYLDQDGKMQTGWVNLNDVWYYMDSSGAMQTGWVQAKPGQWYYLDASGKMLSNTTVDGHQLDASGLRMD